jgi:hypothetical protein
VLRCTFYAGNGAWREMYAKSEGTRRVWSEIFIFLHFCTYLIHFARDIGIFGRLAQIL